MCNNIWSYGWVFMKPGLNIMPLNTISLHGNLQTSSQFRSISSLKMEVHVRLKCWLTSNRLQGIMSKIIELFSIKNISYIVFNCFGIFVYCHVFKPHYFQCNAQWLQLSPLTDISIVGCTQFSQTKAGPCLQWTALTEVHASFKHVWYLYIL
jgi:hypothetical protein